MLASGCHSPSSDNNSAAVTQAEIQPTVEATQPAQLGSEFLGVWMADGTGSNGRFHQTVTISPAGAAFLIVFDSGEHNYNNGGSGTYPATYQGGLLHSSVGLDVAYLPNQNAIMFMGGTFVKTTEEAEASSRARLVAEQQQIAAQQQAARDQQAIRNREAMEKCRRDHPKSICF